MPDEKVQFQFLVMKCEETPMLPLPLSHILSPSLTAIGRLPARATLMPYSDEDALKAGNSQWCQSLDGDWRFQLVGRPGHAEKDWTTQDTEVEPWRDIKVPGVWTMQDTGDLPHYANWQMPFACPKPPDIPADNPTGLYRKVFQLTELELSRNTVLHIGGFESLALVWCNGVFAGMAKDSRLPSEFDLSDFVQMGQNQLAIMVLRWCDATCLTASSTVPASGPCQTLPARRLRGSATTRTRC